MKRFSTLIAFAPIWVPIVSVIFLLQIAKAVEIGKDAWLAEIGFKKHSKTIEQKNNPVVEIVPESAPVSIPITAPISIPISYSAEFLERQKREMELLGEHYCTRSVEMIEFDNVEWDISTDELLEQNGQVVTLSHPFLRAFRLQFDPSEWSVIAKGFSKYSEDGSRDNLYSISGYKLIRFLNNRTGDSGLDMIFLSGADMNAMPVCSNTVEYQIIGGNWSRIVDSCGSFYSLNVHSNIDTDPAVYFGSASFYEGQAEEYNRLSDSWEFYQNKKYRMCDLPGGYFIESLPSVELGSDGYEYGILMREPILWGELDEDFLAKADQLVLTIEGLNRRPDLLPPLE